MIKCKYINYKRPYIIYHVELMKYGTCMFEFKHNNLNCSHITEHIKFDVLQSFQEIDNYMEINSEIVFKYISYNYYTNNGTNII